MGVVYYANYFVWFEVARADLLRTLGWSYREMEHSGVSLPVIEAHCEYRSAAKYDDELEVEDRGAAAVAGPHGVHVRSAPAARRPGGRGRAHRACGARRERPAVPLAGAGSGGVRVKALVTGTRRVHRVAPDRRRCSNAARAVVGIDCFTDYYARGRSRKRTSRSTPRSPASSSSSRASSTADLAGPARRRDARVPSGRAGRRAKELGPRLPDLHRAQRRCLAAAARSLRRPADSRSSSTPRARRSMATR